MSARFREFMLVDDTLKFVTARTEPSLLLIDLSFDAEKNCFQIRSKDPQKNLELLEISLEQNEGVDSSRILQVKYVIRILPHMIPCCF